MRKVEAIIKPFGGSEAPSKTLKKPVVMPGVFH
jgi:hypothetical protein